MQKARSRLSATTAHTPSQLQTETQINPSPRAHPYLRTLPFGLIGVISVFFLIRILTTIPPGSIANLPLPNTYGPVLPTLFAAVFFIFGYLLRNMRRGFLLALGFSSIVFLKLQHIVVEQALVLGIFFGLFCFEFFLTARYISRKN